MSQFDKYTTTEFVEGMRKFLGLKKTGFLREYGFADKEVAPKPGRLPRYSAKSVAALAALVNEKSEMAESINSSIGKRIHIARDYLNLSDAKLAKKMDVSAELVRSWRNDIYKPIDLQRLELALQVPANWLKTGNQMLLCASSHVGVRVGSESLEYREILYHATLDRIGAINENLDIELTQAFLENLVNSDSKMSILSRRAGGRWQFDGKSLVFAAWVPLQKRELKRRYWSDLVESIIKDELFLNETVNLAYKKIQKRCTDLGMTPDMYPKKISIYKRLEKKYDIQKKFGVSLSRTKAFSI